MMKKLWSILLVLALLVTPAMASQAMGWELVRDERVVGPGVSVTTQKLWGDSRSDYRTEQFVTYTPGNGAFPVVAYGANIPAKSTLTSMAKTLEQYYGSRVLAGANGDYFVVATGVPLGMVVTGGVLRSSASYHYAAGFDAAGNAFVGKPELTVWADFKGYHLAVMGGYNKTRVSGDGMTLFNRDFGTATKGSGEGINVILRPVVIPEGYVASAASAANLASAPAQLTIGGAAVTCVVTGVSTQNGSVAIPNGCFILTVGKDSGEFFKTQLASLEVGEQVKLSVTSPDARWSTAQQAIGAYQMLLKDGVVQDGLDNTANPRTAIGVKADGKVILYTMDGRRSGYSVGASMKQVAARLKELGCVDAVLFDGGGSTTFGYTKALDNAFTLQNRPSDGGQRAVTNALFFVSTMKATGTLGSLYVTAPDNLFLPGGKTTLTAQGIDTGYYPMTSTYSDVTYTVSGAGTVAGNVFTAAATTEKTEAAVTATAPGGQQGSVILTVVPTPHTITVADQSTGKIMTALSLEPGQKVDLTASSTWYSLPMTVTDASYTWTVSPEVGTIDASGVLTAGSRAAIGNVTVTAGKKSVTLPVSVSGHIKLLEAWEATSTLPAADGKEILQTELSGEQVRYGKRALKVRYASGTGGVLPLGLPVAAGESDVAFWVYPTEGTNLTLRVTLTDGSEAKIPCNAGTAGKWNVVQAVLPPKVAKLAALEIVPQQPGGGTLYLDHITSTNNGVLDQTPPTVKLTYQDGDVKATLADNADKTFAKERISLTLDGKPLDFTLTGNTVSAKGIGITYATLHRISLTVSDLSGNLARASFQTEPMRDAPTPPQGTVPVPPAFADTENHWARDYADYLYEQGVVKGEPGANGTLLFWPAHNITRGEFVTMLCRWMRLDLSQYAGVKLPFADAASIQPWAVNAVKAAYSLGIFTGSAENGALYARATQTITRAQAMTMLGRVQPRGYASTQGQFRDQAAIPSWAAEYVGALVTQGVVNGYGGYIRPGDPVTRAEVAKMLTVMW